MEAIIDNERPAIKVPGRDTWGQETTILHCMSIDDARKLRDALSDVIKRCVILEAIRMNRDACPTCGSRNVIDGGQACAQCGCDLPNDKVSQNRGAKGVASE